MQKPKQQANISTGNLQAPVGFQIQPASGSGNTNAPAMRPTYSFLPVDQSDINQRLDADQKTWRSNNPYASSCLYPGLDLYGANQPIGARNCTAEAGCAGGRVWVEKSKQCECPDGYWANMKNDPCQPVAKKGAPSWLQWLF
jgi:hypothetical protein